MASVRTLHIVMLTGIMGIGQIMAQVCPYTDPSCSCYNDWITCSDLQEIPPVNRGANVSQVATLYIENGNISSIVNSSLPSGLTRFEIMGNPLTNISDDVFDNSADTLERVSISGSKFNNLPTALMELTKLIDLELANFPIQVWDAAILKHISATLEILYLWNVSLSAWPSWIFDFHLLRKLYLGRNYFKSIPDDAFSFIKDSLTSLDLSFTGLTEIPQALSALSSLTVLNLSGNNFTNVSEVERITRSPFARKLSFLLVGAVGFTRIANFSNLTSLRTINLNFNKIPDVPAGSLPLSLGLLSLSNNILSSVPKDVASMSELLTLSLDNNLIIELEPSAFPLSLTDLNLSFNNLTTITNTSFRNLNLLSSLRLDYNPISTISLSSFVDLISLQFLSIEETHLTEIPLAFTRLSSQMDLYFSFSTTHSLSCPCPAPIDLVQWFTSLTNPLKKFEARCSNGQLVDTYLRGQCG